MKRRLSCADVVATRDKDGYPLVEAGAQKPCGVGA